MARLAHTIGVLIVSGVTATLARVGRQGAEGVTAGTLSLSGTVTGETVTETSLAHSRTVHVEPLCTSASVVRTEHCICFAGVALVVQSAETCVTCHVTSDTVAVVVVRVTWTVTSVCVESSIGTTC